MHTVNIFSLCAFKMIFSSQISLGQDDTQCSPRTTALDDISFHNCEKDHQPPGGEYAEKLVEMETSTRPEASELHNDFASTILHKLVIFYIARPHSVDQNEYNVASICISNKCCSFVFSIQRVLEKDCLH